ncbi:heme ABC exporter ATP-binding protein CcmA [Thalassococcus sp. S3]|uniref:heme ABC exporter ATP-binding protein CcmA n=1 Tax=Thalassococcus sp. S3 TaxID=2017482 RepID=UPI0010248FE3|nr:heme ABC exporter ATP-binding protein CcmA [Thalassococcus sp. S3]QBF33247.1 heme ABC exporter ATP-binding protein CcmA [Thalassococcus sp. S3]
MMLRVTDLTISRGGIPVLQDVCLTLAENEALVLRGPNGIGKTTLLRTVAGLQPPVTGRIEGAEDAIAYAGHSDGLKPTLTVEENLRFWAQIFGTSNIDRALDAFDLQMLRDRPAGSLSAGQKRRLGLSRLLVTARPIWVLDEPTVSLDAHSVSLFADAIHMHRKEGGAALMATHIDLGLETRVLELTAFRAKPVLADADEAFL